MSLWGIWFGITMITSLLEYTQDLFPFLCKAASSMCVPAVYNRYWSSGLGRVSKMPDNFNIMFQSALWWREWSTNSWAILEWSAPWLTAKMWKWKPQLGSPYSIPASSSRLVPSALTSHQGATLPFGVMPWLNSVSNENVCLRISICCCTFNAIGF